MHQLQSIRLDLSELEALRLCDFEGHDQLSAGRRMGISRGTVQRLVSSGRRKILQALLHSQALLIAEGARHEDLYSQRK